MNSKNIPLTQIHTNDGQIEGLPKNPRFIRDNKYKKLVQSIKDDPEMLELRELLVYDTNDEKKQFVVIGGNMRYRVLKELGYKEAPCKIIPNGFPIEKLKRIVLKDNSSFGEIDFDLLINEWELEEIESAAIEIPNIDTPKLEEEAEEDNFDVSANTPKVAKAKVGDIYVLGQHRLICGDSTKEKYLRYLMMDDVADLLLTDPPYNVNYTGGVKSKREGIENDNMEDSAFLHFLSKAFTEADKFLKRGGAFYIWHAGLEGCNFRKAVRNIDAWSLKQIIIWNKNTFTLGRQDYQWKHEPCLYGWKEGASHYFTDKRNLSTIIEEELKNIEEMTKEDMKNILIKIREELPTTVFNENKPLKSEDHPTMKPIPLIGKQILNSTRRGDIVLDLFGGSGTTLIACEQIGRRCRIVEFEPQYVDVIIKRWEEQTNLKAEFLANIEDNESNEETNDGSPA